MCASVYLWIKYQAGLVLMPITRDSQCSMVNLNTHLRKAREARWANATEKQKHDFASAGGHAYWDSMTKAERSAEMKRRAEVRKKNRAAKRRRRKRNTKEETKKQ